MTALIDFLTDSTAQSGIVRHRSALSSLDEMNRFNEGKACDAVVRRIESREHSRRQNVRSPEKEGDVAPIELTCTIGGQLFAFEHTGIEAFDGQIDIEVQRHFQPLRTVLSGKIPQGENYDLHVPAGATLNLTQKQIGKTLLALETWIETEGPKLKLATLGRSEAPIERPADATVPFKVRLYRCAFPGPGQLSIAHLVDNLEDSRKIRIERACRKKYGKLEKWKKRGARTVLILDENDIQLTNAIDVCRSRLEAEKSFKVLPDEVYLVTTSINPWYVWFIRVDRRSFFDLTDPNERAWEVDPDALLQITVR